MLAVGLRLGVLACLLALGHTHLRGNTEVNGSTTEASDFNRSEIDSVTSLISVRGELQEAPPSGLAAAGDFGNEEVEVLSVPSNDTIEVSELVGLQASRATCITKQTKKALDYVNPWRASKTKYAYKWLESGKSPHGQLTTDCSGFVSWVIAQGCGKSYLDEIWKQSVGPTSQKYCWWKNRKCVEKRVKASGFFRAFTRGSGLPWTTVGKVKQIRPGDVLAFRIKTKGNYISNDKKHKCADQEDKANDSGHVMIVVGKAYPAPELGQCKSFTRYRMKIADSSKKAHYNGNSGQDTRVGCSTKKCGIGAGWVYVWADQSDNLVSLGLRPYASDHTHKGTRCPPSRNMKCHDYVVGRFER